MVDTRVAVSAVADNLGNYMAAVVVEGEAADYLLQLVFADPEEQEVEAGQPVEPLQPVWVEAHLQAVLGVFGVVEGVVEPAVVQVLVVVAGEDTDVVVVEGEER